MSRRSIFLATTFFVAIGSLAAIGPASAHGFGFGGFGGDQSVPASAARSPGTPGPSNIGRTPVTSMNNSGGGARFEHEPVGAPAAQNNAAVSRIEPARIPAAANAPIASAPAASPSVRPAQLPQTITSTGIVARQPDAAGIVNVPISSRLSAAGIVSAPVTARYPVIQPSGIEPGASARLKDTGASEAGAKLLKPGSNPEVPNVAGNPTVAGHGPEHGLSSSGVSGGRPTVSPPGVQGLGQPGHREDPGSLRMLIADLQRKMKDLRAREVAIKIQMLEANEQIAALESECKAQIQAAEKSLQESGGGAVAGAIIGGVVGGPLGALAGADVGATIGATIDGAESGTVPFDLSACKRLGDRQKQLSDFQRQLSITQAARADVDAALAKAMKEEAEEARQQPHDAELR